MSFDVVTLNSGRRVRQLEVGNYVIDFHEGGGDLVVTFENGSAQTDRHDKLRDPWCFSLLTRLGYSVLGVKALIPDWYRGPRLLEWFGSGAAETLLAKFDSHVFLGGSMGGFGALTFSRVVPGAAVIVFNPQSTMRRDLVPWENRFSAACKYDWSGAFADAAEAAPLARRIHVFYDPLCTPDRRHVLRMDHPNVVHLKMPFLGHSVPLWLNQLGLFDQATEQALDGSLTSSGFAKMIRKRRGIARYYEVAEKQLKEAGRPHLARLFNAAARARASRPHAKPEMIKHLPLIL